MKPIQFKAVLMSGHKGNAAEVPFDPGARWPVVPKPLWPGRRGFAVLATLNGKPFESAIVPRSRRFWLLVPAALSDSAGVSLGESGTFSVAPR